MARHLFHQRAERGDGPPWPKGAKRALPQQPRRHVYRRNRKGRSRIPMLGDGCIRRRLQQRWLARSSRYLLRRRRSLSQQRRRNIYRRDQECRFGRRFALATGAAFGDYDNDGWADLFVSHYVDFHLDNMAAFGSADTCRYMGIPVQCGPRGLKGSPDTLYHNNRDGTFTDVSEQSGVGDPERRYGLTAIWSDFDNDGKLDLLVTNDSQPNYLYKGNGAGKFVDVAFSSGVALNENGAAQANMGVALGDYLHTGLMSLLLSHFDNEYAALYRNNGNMNFSDASFSSGIARGTTGYVGWGDAFVDFDNDGWQDFFLVNGHVYPQVDSLNLRLKYREPKLLFVNQRNGTFKDISHQAGPAIEVPQVSRGMAAGDLFNDGKIEAVVENLVGSPMILRPEGHSENHWISFQLEGVKSNRLALNARVQATAGDLVQLGEVVSGGSYLSQNDLRIHFGLGKHERVDRAKVSWPDGKTEILNNLAADRFYTIREGGGVVSSKASGPRNATQ